MSFRWAGGQGRNSMNRDLSSRHDCLLSLSHFTDSETEAQIIIAFVFLCVFLCKCYWNSVSFCQLNTRVTGTQIKKQYNDLLSCPLPPTPGVTVLTSVGILSLACLWVSHRCSHSACVIFGALHRGDVGATLQVTCWGPWSSLKEEADATLFCAVCSWLAFQGPMRVRVGLGYSGDFEK